jgi:hypothetical protein
MQALEAALLETAGAGEQDGRAEGKGRESMGAGDEPFLDHLLRVFLDVPTGSLRREDIAAERTDTTWKAVGDERRKALGSSVRSLVNERAQALM